MPQGQGPTATVQYAPIATSAAGSTTIVPATPGKRIRVIGLQLTAAGAVNIQWQTSTGAVNLTGLAYLAPNGGEVLPESPRGWFQTAAGDALALSLSAAVAVGGSLTYVLV